MKTPKFSIARTRALHCIVCSIFTQISCSQTFLSKALDIPMNSAPWPMWKNWQLRRCGPVMSSVARGETMLVDSLEWHVPQRPRIGVWQLDWRKWCYDDCDDYDDP